MADSRPYLRALTGLSEDDYDRTIARPARQMALPIWLGLVTVFVLLPLLWRLGVLHAR